MGMELTVQIGFEQLVRAVKQLSAEEKRTLQSVLQEETALVRPSKERQFGTMKGLVVYMADDFDAPLDDFNEYM